MKTRYLDEFVDETNSISEDYLADVNDESIYDTQDQPDFESDYEELDESGIGENSLDWISNPIELLEGYRKLLNTEFRKLDWNLLDESLSDVMDSMSVEEEINFGSILNTIGSAGSKVLQNKTVGDIGRTVLPAAGSLVGTLYGGPVGTAIGGDLGQLASKALFKGSANSSTLTSAPVTHNGSGAAAQLLQLTQNPAILNALGSLAMGSAGNTTVQTANNQSIPVGSIMSMLSQLTRQASEDADHFMNGAEGSYNHFRDGDGEYVVDVANPEARAQALYAILAR